MAGLKGKFMSKAISLVKVEWVDSCNHNGWQPADGIDTIASCTSVGWVIRKNKTEICLAPSIDEDNSNVCSAISIPRKAIIRVAKLKESTC